MRSTQCLLVFVTTPDLKTARALAKAALHARLAACANLLQGVESHYQWKGKMERSREVMMILKTTRARVSALEKLIIAQHPYETPEFVVGQIKAGNAKYLAWVEESCRVGLKRSIQ